MVRRTRGIDNQAQDTPNRTKQMWFVIKRDERKTREVNGDSRARQLVWEARLRDTEQQVARLRGASTSSASPPDTSRHD